MPKLGAVHENLDTKIYNELKGRIMRHAFRPGEKIYQDKLARELGVSRTPLVNALKYLEREKLVVAIPRRGYIVRRFSTEEMVHIFELREVLEGLAARRAALGVSDAHVERLQGFFEQFRDPADLEDVEAYAREDRRFHQFVVEVGSREFLKSILENYNVLAFSYQSEDSAGLVRPPRETIREHQAIIKAICKRDPEKAEEFMRLHLRRSMTVLELTLPRETGLEAAS